MVGIGPGNPLDRTRRAEQTIGRCGVIVGYTAYVERIRDLVAGQQVVTSGMTKEVDRCRIAAELAASGEDVALVSSGDAGVYGMAGLALQLVNDMSLPLTVEIIPGVSAAHAAAARMGAPLMLDAAFISLSDLLVSWEMIEQRLEAVAAADLVVALYNPRSKKRVSQLERAVEILRRHREDDTVVGVGTGVSTAEERIVLTDLGHLLEQDVGMSSTVIVGNSTSSRLGEWFVTPRGYNVRTPHRRVFLAGL